MSITYPLTVPNNNIASMTMSLAFAVGSSISPFTFQQQVAGFAGERWAINFGPPAMVREDAEEWIAMALALRGEAFHPATYTNTSLVLLVFSTLC